MGVKLKDILQPQPTSFEELSHQVIAVDAFNMLYQFITTIRMRDGKPLKNSKGQPTSHLIGLLSRTSNFLEHQIKPVFIFDGESPQLKRAEQDRRRAIKKQAKEKHQAAEARGDITAMKKYAGRTAKLTSDMIQESKQLLEALGVPWIQAPAEAEAQAALLVQAGDADYVASQDMDSLLFGAPKMIKNLSITGKRKRPGTSSYYTIEPEIITLQTELNRLGITQQQLILLGMLVGTDFNPSGIKGIGPKTALKKVKEYGEDAKQLFADVEWEEHNDVSWQEVHEVLTNMPTTKDYEIAWSTPDEKKLRELLVDEFEFSEERVTNTVKKLTQAQQQKGLRDYF